MKMIIEMARNHAFAMFVESRGKKTKPELIKLKNIGYEGESDSEEVFEQHPIGDIQSFVYGSLMSNNFLNELEGIKTLNDIKSRFSIDISSYQKLDGLYDEIGGKISPQEVRKIINKVNRDMLTFILNNAAYNSLEDDDSSLLYRYFHPGEEEGEGIGDDLNRTRQPIGGLGSEPLGGSVSVSSKNYEN